MIFEPMRWCVTGQHRVYALDFRDEKRATCNACHNARERTFRANNRDHVRARELNRRGKYLVHNARRRAERQGVPFDLDEHATEVNSRVAKGVCELTGLPFNKGDAPRDWDSPTIDRIESSKGYILSNIRIVCWGVNAALGTWGEEQLMVIADALRRRS